MSEDAGTYRLLVDVHQVVSDAQKGKNPPKAFVTDDASLVWCWLLDLDFAEELVAFVGVPVRKPGNIWSIRLRVGWRVQHRYNVPSIDGL